MEATTVLKLVATVLFHKKHDYYQFNLYSILCVTKTLLTLISCISPLTWLVDKITVFKFTANYIKFLRFREKVEIPELIRGD